ncbi:MAG: SMP-30/gluconolactonase/LRE family protein [Planctomycetaceae bacterium]|nr:SMP-30/gluconolactonase/LRE family protein [Planctomycetaceae bacterium]
MSCQRRLLPSVSGSLFNASIGSLLSIVLLALSPAMAQEENYPIPPESVVRDGVPQGKVHGPFEFRSRIYPGTVREYWVYVPSQYDPARPPCLMIVQDGLGRAGGWKIPTILDNLIHAGEVPVQLGIFVGHGQVPAPHGNAQPRFNRSFEYDSLGDRYARFLIEELLPEVRRSYTFSDNPDDRCLAGSSSGAICAFNAAWERPDAFRRVISTVGTYVGLRGADQFPVLIRKTEPKPLRVFLQDGSNDLDIYGGSWWHANQAMLSALQFSGYDVRHVWGEGGHNAKHSTAIMPEAMRWIWRDYPQPIANIGGRQRRTDLLIPGEEWQQVSSGHGFTEGPAVNDSGELFFTDIPEKKIHRVDASGTVSVFAENTGSANGLAIGPDGRVYACRADDQQVVRYAADGSRFDVVVEGIKGNDLIVLPDGSGYVTEPNEKRIWHFRPDGTKKIVDTGIEFPNGVMTSPDQTLLTVSDTRGRFCYSFHILPDGGLTAKQEYGWMHVTDHLETNGDGMAVDTEGRMYVTTAVGLQVMDQLGRVHFIFNKPKNAWLSNVTFGGKDRDVLYVTIGDSVYRRRIKATGVNPAKAPIAPPKPGL